MSVLSDDALWDEVRLRIGGLLDGETHAIACMATVPVVGRGGRVLSVLDVDSDPLDTFDAVDPHHLEGMG